jgi:LacI family transcriptional regulator
VTVEPIPRLPWSKGARAVTTISDIARRAGVGVGTVSRVLNRSPNVSEATRQRVLDVIEELEYTPSSMARRLSLGRTLTVAAVVPFITHASAVQRLQGVVAAMRGSAYDLTVFDVETPHQRTDRLREIGRGDRADGVIVLSLHPTDEDVARLERNGVTTVLVDARHPRLARFVIDDVAGGELAVRHLLELGHRRIGFVGDAQDEEFGFTSSRERQQGYVAALEACGIGADAALVRTGPHERGAAGRLAHELLRAKRRRPTAVFAASDTQALGVLEAAADAGISVPDELSVIGFDDIDLAAYVGLTTVRQPLYESGLRGGKHLLGTLQGDADGARETVLPLELVVRRTTGPAA